MADATGRQASTAQEIEQQFLDVIWEGRTRWLREQYERADFILYRRLGFWWQIEILPALESWDPALAWIHEHRPIYAGF